MITQKDLISDADLETRGAWVRDIIVRCLATPAGRIQFFGRYAQWNGLFGSGVATLSGKIGRSTDLFIDTNEPIKALGDRSVLVASYIFDAARDEFNDHNTKHRDTHRCLAQAALSGVIEFERGSDPVLATADNINGLLSYQPWLEVLCNHVADGYGAHTNDSLLSIFQAMGYHLGSELLADQEFSVIDETLRNEFPDLAEALQNRKVKIGSQDHVPYAWISIHSGYGGGAEAEHFEWATRGIRLGLELTPKESRAVAMEALRNGFAQFAKDHQSFFTEVSVS